MQVPECLRKQQSAHALVVLMLLLTSDRLFPSNCGEPGTVRWELSRYAPTPQAMSKSITGEEAAA